MRKHLLMDGRHAADGLRTAGFDTERRVALRSGRQQLKDEVLGAAKARRRRPPPQTNNVQGQAFSAEKNGI
ncbi:hypothetical protein ACFOPN_14610 [Xanthomonas hyacinthi]|uniref:hypothetical protein n=1 Tax=Xanthomonas hyacinthi TaxID=56455 RepID=UPI0036204360